MSNGTVKILMSGVPQKTVEIQEDETLAELVQRVSSSSLPLNKVETLYLNGSPVSDPGERQLRPGDVVGGAPKLDGG